jgi:hypothetical protein
MPALLGPGSSTRIMRSAGDASEVEQSGQPSWSAATAVKSTSDGWAGWGASAVMPAVVAGLERASATALAAPGVWRMSAVYSLMNDS